MQILSEQKDVECCYSCHWKIDKLEEVRLQPFVMSNSAFIEKHPKPAIIERSLLQQLILPQQQQGQTMVIDVYGQQT
jgi:hypothetical protein